MAMVETALFSHSRPSSRAPSHVEPDRHRTLTASSAVSDCSTLKDEPLKDPLMLEVFSVVSLPDVEYRHSHQGDLSHHRHSHHSTSSSHHHEHAATAPVSHGSHQTSVHSSHQSLAHSAPVQKVHSSHHGTEHDLSALDAIDGVLEREETHSYRSSLTSLASPTSPAVAHHVAEHVVDDLMSQIFANHTLEEHHAVVHHDEPVHSAPLSSHHTSVHSSLHNLIGSGAEPVHDHVSRHTSVTSSHGGHSHAHEQHSVLDEINRLQHEEEERRLIREREQAEELMRELEDEYEMLSIPASRRSSVASSRRTGPMGFRTMTVDSLVSTAETRFGDWDVANDIDEDEINLLHNEVAYERPKKPKIPAYEYTNGAAYPRPNEADVAELAAVQQKIELARQHIAHLEAQLAEARAASGHRSRHTSHHSHHSHRSYIGAGAAPIGSHSRAHSVAGDAVYGRFAQDAGFIYEEDVGISEIAAREIKHGHEIGKAGRKSLIVPAQREVQSNGNVTKVIIGGDAPHNLDDKTVLLFGPVGSGKTSLINSMLNYLYDVRKENGFRFLLSEHSHPSRGLRAYVFNNTILPFSVTIVDTPGVPEINGDRTVSTLVQSWFEQELHSAGHFRLDAISIVLRHDERRLEWPFIHELAAVKRMFGDDLKTNVLPIITHTEVLPQPVAVRSLAQANISFLEYYKINNGGFFPTPTGDMSRLKHNLFYKHGSASLEKFFKDLQEIIHPLLAVLRTQRLSSSTGLY